ncbi:hypothetical protein [Thermosphaera aggregans]|uniref:Uncharacterized protein n=1 Tax=Thermosphaera aggregans (strain DSM 11486 / M11TL) TaxID=633148 RepID=D5U0A3_THEAM|nr:hypothetical protein [Thermosphaera aggregans]ADG90553.1 hypothetical protein Tagg_0276 [Thermosphaera aggregans DSM 11486]
MEEGGGAGEKPFKEIKVETGKTDAEELREVLDAVTPFLEKLKDWVKEIIGLFTSGLDGKKLGEDIGRFYQELKAQGLPEDLIIEMVKDYYKKRMEVVPSIEKLIGSFAKFGEFWRGEEEHEEDTK